MRGLKEGESMRYLRTVRVLTVIAVAVPASLAAWAVSGAGAASAPATCAVLNATLTGTGSVSKCTDPANTGGSGKIVANVAKKTGKVTWNKTGTSTFSLTYSTVKTDEKETKSCPKGTTEILFNGKVTGGTGAAIKSIPKGQAVTAEVCVSKTAVTLEPGTVIRV
jgi:hypothetical protein